MKLPFQPALIQANFFAHYASPIEINFGDCYKWAWIAYKLFNDVELFSHEVHAFVRYRGKFYDSETTNGIKNYRRLRTIKENAEADFSSYKMTSHEFIAFWGVYNQCDWTDLNARINLFGQSIIARGKLFG